jgi:integrase
MLAELLVAWRAQPHSPWLFANPITEMPYMSPSLQQRWIRPAGEAIGIEGLGFHSLRHSYRSWLDATGAAPGVTKDLMRHSAIPTTFNVYGKALSPEKRDANNRVVELLLASNTAEAG